MPKDTKTAPVDKATKAAKAVQKGTRVVKRKIRTTPRFTRPHTLRLKTSPKYAQVAVPKTGGLDKFSIIQRPIFSEANMREIEKQNTLTFIVDPRANKRQISLAIKALYNVDVVKVNTLIRPDGKKKAYCRLSPDVEAFEVANRMGLY